MASNVLADRDVNAAQLAVQNSDVKTMEYHRQVLQSKLEQEQGQQTYISPSDSILSPCTAKLSAYRSKHLMKAKPKSLFAKTSAKNINQEHMFGEKTQNVVTGEKSTDGQ